MDPGSIIGLIAFATSATGFIGNCIKSVVQAPTEIVSLHNELSSLKAILLQYQNMQGRLCQGSPPSPHFYVDLTSCLTRIQELFEELNRLLHKVFKESRDGRRRFSRRVWLRKKSTIGKLKSDLTEARYNLRDLIGLATAIRATRIELQLVVLQDRLIDFQSVNLLARTLESTDVSEPYTQNPVQPAIDLAYQYVLLCVPVSGRIRYRQLVVGKHKSDTALLNQLTMAYFSMIGPWRRLFSPKRFSHCRSSQLTKWAPNVLSWRRYALPSDSDYEYTPKPSKEPYMDLITPYEWYMRFHRTIDVGESRQILDRVPKRRKVFQISSHSEREELWGLHVYYEFSALGVACWSLLLSAGPLIFFVLWLRARPDDVQTALTPLTTVLAIVMAFWMALGKNFVELI